LVRFGLLYKFLPLKAVWRGLGFRRAPQFRG
jgi:hypothetical protein